MSTDESSEGELAAMVSFAIAFPDGFMALVDTYDVKRYSRLLGAVYVYVLVFFIFKLFGFNLDSVSRNDLNSLCDEFVIIV